MPLPKPPLLKRLLPGAALMLLSACSSVQMSPPTRPLDRSANWALLPVLNTTGTPQAGLRVEAITASLLQNAGIQLLSLYPATSGDTLPVEPGDRRAQEEALKWASGRGAVYAIGGSVTEWHYKAGVDAEPAVGLTLQIIDLGSGQTIWSATGSKTGWSREAVAAVAQNLLQEMLAGAGLH